LKAIIKLKIEITKVFDSPEWWYLFRAILIWPDGPFKGTVSRDFLLQKPLKITVGSFQIFSKVFSFATGVNDTSGAP
jgi:hypothetical protein